MNVAAQCVMEKRGEDVEETYLDGIDSLLID